ncbi:MAG TPA: serine/threonine-protein kinase [Candidatus Dormibacteraeota bacterium]|nr:serine/threonine-protein kinase [Candidatus Dormibacteraeota bacterium]
MSAEQREEAVFEAALQVAASERGAYLDDACAGDADLRRRVGVLLGAFERAGSFMNQAATPEARFSLPPTEKPGDKIGSYKLLEQIGEGGCGVVYVAEQEEPVRRRVALKVIKLGMDTRQAIARFDAERQALAMMDHPNIAKIHDAGVTDTGRPYFVMELVRGIRITDYCDQNQLGAHERLDLFIQVCRAIQHAHQKGVIHRDIKPSNILVTLHDGVPVPKVIDFGIAKATQGRLTDQTVYTAFEQFIGTPAYMSPEQAEMSGLDIDTRSDIYSLGVLLYELLTGKTPFDAKELLAAGLDAMRRTIREVEPLKPSTRLTQERAARSGSARPEIRNPKSDIDQDLDWIVMKCLEKDRGRRYETANGLATDIVRHLSNEPIIARPPSQLYRFQKSVQRNKLAFGAVTAVALTVVIGLAVSMAMYFKAETEKKKAQTEAAKSKQTAQFLKDMLKGVGPSVAVGRDTTMLREIVGKTIERLGPDLQKQPEVEIDLRLTLAWVYFDLQDFKKMEQTARETLRLARAHLGQENMAVADALSQLGRALQCLGRGDEAESFTRQAALMQRQFLGHDSLEEASSLEHLGDILRFHKEDRARLAEAENALRTSLAIRRRRLGNGSDESAWALHHLSHVLREERKLSESEDAIREALAIHQKNHGESHPWSGLDYYVLANSLEAQKRFDDATTAYQKALDILEGTAAYQAQRASARVALASIIARQGKSISNALENLNPVHEPPAEREAGPIPATPK